MARPIFACLKTISFSESWRLLALPLLLGMLLLAANSVIAQQLSNVGREFWLGYGHNVLFTADNPPNGQNLTLYLSTEKATTVTVSINGTSWSQSVNIPANTVDFSVVIPKSGPNDARIRQEGKFERGIHIVSSEPIVAYAHQYGVQSSGATMLFPVEAYGYSYTSVNYDQVTNFGTAYSWLFVVASEDNTRLEFVPSDSTQGGWLPGETYKVELQKGEIYNVFGRATGNQTSKDLTGTKVRAVEGADGKCHPFASFSGSSRIILCSGNGGEVMWQQIFPRSAWGNTYLTHPTLNNLSGNVNIPFTNIYRIVVTNPSTIVKRNGTVLNNLQPKGYYEFSSNTGEFIEADQPVMVTQYMHSSNECVGVVNPPRGDPEMFILSPLQQGIKRVQFYNTRNQDITVNYVDFIVHKNGFNSLRLNGASIPAALSKPHPNNADYVFAARRLLGGGAQYTITCDSPFVSRVYGLGDFESYGYLAGTLINNLNALPGIDNTLKTVNLEDTFTCTNTPFNFKVRLAYKATTIKWELSALGGVINGADTTISNPVPLDSVIEKGRKYFVYTLNRPYIFDAEGRYVIKCEATSPEIDHCDKTEIYTQEVIVKLPPLIPLSIAYSGCVSDTATFTAADPGWLFPPAQYVWQLNNGPADTTGNEFRNKLNAGNNILRVVSIAENGCVSDSSFSISPTLTPVAAFNLNKAAICLGDSILVTDQSAVTAGSGAIATRWYDFGDGSPVVQRTNNSPFLHVYATAGSFTIKQWVATANGCKSDTAAQTVAVADKPVAGFTMPTNICDSSAVSFVPSVPGTGITNYRWDMGNGQIINNPTPSPVTATYTYPTSNIVVTLTVTASGGCNSDVFSSSPFNVSPRPEVSLALLSDTLCTQKNIELLGAVTIATGTVQTTSWLRDGVYVGDLLPRLTTTFQSAGIHTIALAAVSDAGCTDTAYQQFTVSETPMVDAGPRITVPAGGTGILQGSVTGSGTYSYLWTPATYLNDASLLQPTVSPQANTVYLLTVSSDAGNCIGSDTTEVIILDEIKIPNAFSPNGDGINDRWQIPGLNAYPYATVRVFDRYGRLVLQTTGYNQPWDGTRNGQPVPAGVYYYIIDKGDKSDLFKGSITILK